MAFNVTGIALVRGSLLTAHRPYSLHTDPTLTTLTLLTTPTPRYRVRHFWLHASTAHHTYSTDSYRRLPTPTDAYRAGVSPRLR